MIGKKILHYKIIEKLGEGGMGIVYLADDSKLKRPVAIKFLPSHIATNSDERKRFEIEAQAAAALNHPNIATIYSIEEADNEHFIVMEYITGKHLKDYISSQPPDVEEALAIAIQIAEGLEAAHKKGIVHRDIKSANIMRTDDGKVKIMDFGLAKFRGSAQLTQIGTTLGTAAYMSPEQAKGEDVDQRSDIWSFGVVLYELLCGSLPFTGDYEQAIIYCIVNEDFSDIQSMRADIPATLQEIIKKALQKNIKDRYQNSRELLEDLLTIKRQYIADSQNLIEPGINNTAQKRPHIKKKLLLNFKSSLVLISIILTIALSYVYYLNTTDSINTLAVLPFINTSNDPDTQYLTEGISANLINRLSEFPSLKVMSRHSVARFKEEKVNPVEAGHLLDVQAVLTGEIDVRGKNLILNVELLLAEDGRQLWGERIERPKTDILSVENDIVSKISNKLKVKIGGDNASANADDISFDPKAYDLYLRGRHIMLGTTDDGPARAQEYFQRAIEIEPRLAVAYAALGESYVNQAWLASRKRSEMVPLAKAALNKAMALNDRLSEAFVLAGEIALFFDWDWSAAKTAYEKAIEISPGSDLAHREYSSFLSLMDRPEEAITQARIARTLDPLSVYAAHQLGYGLLAAGRLPEAAEAFTKAIDLNPTWVWGNIKLGLTLALMGERDKALAALNRADELLTDQQPSPLAQSWLAQIAYLCGDPQRARKTIEDLEKLSKISFVDPIALADLYLRMGDFDKLFESLQHGYEIRTPLMAFILLERRFNWKVIADDPRYLDMIKRLNFPTEAF